MIKLKNILSEQKDPYTYTYPNDTMYKYAVKNGVWWAKNVQTGKEFDLSANPKFQSSIDKLEKQYPKARPQKTTNTTDNQNTTENPIVATVLRNKNGWMISPTVKTQQTLKSKSLGADIQKLFTTLRDKARADLKQQLVGKTIKVRNIQGYVPVFNEEWAQYDLNAFNGKGWPTDANYGKFKPATISGQTVGDVYVLMSWKNSGMDSFTTKFECSIVFVGGKINGWIPTSYIDVV